VIPVEEIKEIARRVGVPESTIERDYAQGWLLAHLSSYFDMALKGGTGIRKVFLGDYRFSDDLDFTLLDEYGVDDVEVRVKDAVRAAKRESGIDFEEEVIVEETDNGYQVSLYFRFLRRTGSPLRIKLDLTRKENEIVSLPLEKRMIIHPYTDIVGAKVLSYSLAEVFAEKIRALFERTRPRDLYDVWRLSELDLDVSGIINDKFGFKDVTLDIDDLYDRREDFRNAWENSLRHQLEDLPVFTEVFEDVVIFLKGIPYAV